MRKHDPVLHLKDLRKWAHTKDHFKISKVENTTTYSVEDYISTSDVEALLENGWKITISPVSKI